MGCRYNLPWGTVTTEEDKKQPFSLRWDTLPEPPVGCYNTPCVNGLVVDVLYRKGDTFVPYWHGQYTYMEPGVIGWVQYLPGTSGVGGYVYEQDVRTQNISFVHDGEYYLFIHRPQTIQSVHVPPKRGIRTALREFFGIPRVFAYNFLEHYAENVVGGVKISVHHPQSFDGVLALPEEAGYDEVRGVHVSR